MSHTDVTVLSFQTKTHNCMALNLFTVFKKVIEQHASDSLRACVYILCLHSVVSHKHIRELKQATFLTTRTS